MSHVKTHGYLVTIGTNNFYEWHINIEIYNHKELIDIKFDVFIYISDWSSTKVRT